MAEAAFKSAEVIGYPECRINLAQAALYVCLAPKSNACEAGIDAALAEVRHGPRREVPNHLRDRHRPGSDSYGPYLYPHNYPEGWVEQQYLPDGLERGQFFSPSGRGWEAWRLDVTSSRSNGGDAARGGGSARVCRGWLGRPDAPGARICRASVPGYRRRRARARIVRGGPCVCARVPNPRRRRGVVYARTGRMSPSHCTPAQAGAPNS